MAIWFLAFYFVRQYFGACHNSPLNFLIQASEKFAGWLLKNRFKGQDRLQFRLTCEPLMSAQFGTAVISQKKSHFLLGKRRAFAGGS